MVALPHDAEIPLLRPIAAGIGRRLFAVEHVNGRVCEVLDAAGMVEVEMRQHDMPQVERAIAQLLDLAQRRLLLVELDAVGQHEEAADPLAGALHVAYAEAGIDRHQAGAWRSIKKQWQTSRRSNGSSTGPYIVPQLRWWMRIAVSFGPR